MLIRRYQSGDETEVAVVYNSAFKDDIESLPDIYQYNEVTVNDVIEWLQGNTVIWVAEVDNRIIGYAQVRVDIECGKKEVPVLHFIPKKWDLEQSNIAVLPEFQRSGVGTKLVQEITEKYKNTAEIATAYTFSDNRGAERLFESSGFAMHDAFYYSDYAEDRPFANSSVFETLELENLKAPNNLNPHITFRRATLDDVVVITEIHRHNVFWCDECSTLQWNRDFIMGKYGHTVFVVEGEGEVVGAIDYYKDGRVGISGVLPSMTKRGIGSAMFYNILLAMKEEGYKIAFMDSGLTQIDAIKMYERFGFSIQRRQNAWIKQLL